MPQRAGEGGGRSAAAAGSSAGRGPATPELGAGGGTLQGDVPLDHPDIWRRSMHVRGQLPRGQGIHELHGALERVQAHDEGCRAQRGRTGVTVQWHRETSVQALKMTLDADPGFQIFVWGVFSKRLCIFGWVTL